jgi:hypothetical protein
MSFKVIDGDGPGKEERERQRRQEWAKDEFSGALREMAANMLRIVRGAGKGYELLRQMQSCSRPRSSIAISMIIGLVTI